jgi:hypothetical protein
MFPFTEFGPAHGTGRDSKRSETGTVLITQPGTRSQTRYSGEDVRVLWRADGDLVRTLQVLVVDADAVHVGHGIGRKVGRLDDGPRAEVGDAVVATVYCAA